MKNRPAYDWTEENVDRFMRAYVETFSMETAAAAVGATYNQVQGQRRRDPEFKKLLDETKKRALDLLVATAWEAATKGWVREPIMYRGEQVKDADGFPMFKRQLSERMMELLMRSHMPDIYREVRRDELTGRNGAPLIPESNTLEMARRVAFLLTSGARGKQETPVEPDKERETKLH